MADLWGWAFGRYRTYGYGHVLLEDKKGQNDFYSGCALIGRAKGLAQLSGLEKGIGKGLHI